MPGTFPATSRRIRRSYRDLKSAPACRSACVPTQFTAICRNRTGARTNLAAALTDGFEEAVSPEEEMFGTERVLEIVRKNREHSAADIVQALHQAFQDFTGNAPQLDDLTAIVIKVR